MPPRLKPRPQRNVSPPEPLVFRPHAGQQSKYFQVVADIVIYGGAASGGKSYALLHDALMGINYHNYEAALFRATYPMLKMGGGLRNESKKIYPKAGGTFNETEMEWRFPSTNSRVRFYSCDNPSKYDGLQVAFLGFDQLEQFSAADFWHLRSRLRSESDAPRKIRATCNPDPGWLEQFLKAGGWVGRDGYPVDAMDGVVKWFLREKDGDAFAWEDTREAFRDKANLAASLTFIKAMPEDNPTNLANNPDYLATLESLPLIERLKKRYGNWNAKPSAGMIFKSAWWGYDGCRMPDSHPRIVLGPPPRAAFVRAYDVGWSETGDWTVGVLMAQDATGWYVVDAIRFRARDTITIDVIKRVAAADEAHFGRGVTIALPHDPGKGGVDQLLWARELGAAGYTVRCKNDAEFGNKIARCRFASPQCEMGHVKLCRTHPSQSVIQWLSTVETAAGSGRFVEVDPMIRAGDWHRPLVEALDALADDCAHAVTDWTDAFSKAFNVLTKTDGAGVIHLANEAGAPPTQEKRDLFRELNGSWGRPGIGGRGRGFLE